MRRKVIAFDLDGTLAPSKSPLPDRMSAALEGLLARYQVCVISGGKIEQFHKQLLNNLRVEPELLANLHLMPTCGTRYYRYNAAKKAWDKVYAEDFTPSQTKRIIAALAKVSKELGYEEKQVWGDVIEDRGSQVTWSALGQDIVDHLGLEGVRLKEEWDADNAKKNKMRDQVALLIPEFEVRVGGITSIDVTRPGIDKGYGMKKLVEMLKIKKQDVFFVGDRVVEGGNDYAVKLYGIDCMQINVWEETALVIEAINQIS